MDRVEMMQEAMRRAAAAGRFVDPKLCYRVLQAVRSHGWGWMQTVLDRPVGRNRLGAPLLNDTELALLALADEHGWPEEEGS